MMAVSIKYNEYCANMVMTEITVTIFESEAISDPTNILI